MKMILGVVSVVIVGYMAWHWFAPTAVAPPPAQHSAPRPAAAHPPPPKRLAQQPAAKPTPARPVTPQPRLAPEGTYFLLERASLRIDSGVIGFAPGTKVTLLDQAIRPARLQTDNINSRSRRLSLLMTSILQQALPSLTTLHKHSLR